MRQKKLTNATRNTAKDRAMVINPKANEFGYSVESSASPPVSLDFDVPGSSSPPIPTPDFSLFRSPTTLGARVESSVVAIVADELFFLRPELVITWLPGTMMMILLEDEDEDKGDEFGWSR